LPAMAKIADLLAAGRTYSFEFFPPTNDAEPSRLVQTLIGLGSPTRGGCRG
jgi:hypothetical protein